MKKILAILSMLIIFSTGCGNTSTAVDDVKKDAAEKVQEAAGEVKETATKVEQKAVDVAKNNSTGQNAAEKFSLGGIYPDMTLEEVKKILGEPASNHGDEFIFSNGLVVEIDDHGNVVEEIKTPQAGVSTGGVEVGMTEKNLTDAYGAADNGSEFSHCGKSQRTFSQIYFEGQIHS